MTSNDAASPDLGLGEQDAATVDLQEPVGAPTDPQAPECTSETTAEPTTVAGRPRRRRRLLIAGAAGLGVLWWLGWHSPMTLVEHVVVDPPRGISAESIRLASGISAADHVPSVDEGSVRRGIMEAIPAVADVQVRRSLPHRIRLDVTARTPLAAVPSGDGFLVIDAEGVVFDKVGSAKKLPVLRVSSDENRDIARSVLAAIPEDVGKRVVLVTAQSRDDVTLELRSGVTVRWGSAEDAALKARVLAGLMAVDATQYDVSAPLLPTTKGS